MGLRDRLLKAKEQVRVIKDDYDEKRRLQHKREIDRLNMESERLVAKSKKAEDLAFARQNLLSAKARLKNAEIKAEKAKHPPQPVKKATTVKRTPRRTRISSGGKTPRITPRTPKLR